MQSACIATPRDDRRQGPGQSGGGPLPGAKIDAKDRTCPLVHKTASRPRAHIGNAGPLPRLELRETRAASGAGGHEGGGGVVRVAVQVLAGRLQCIVVRGPAWWAAIWTSRWQMAAAGTRAWS
jgi:hypothetical protein